MVTESDEPEGCPPIFRHALFRNNGDGTYTDVAEEAGVAIHPFNWGAAFIDLENSGTQDFRGVFR